VLCGAVGSVVWGAAVDRVGMRAPRARFPALAALCLLALAVLVTAFGAPHVGVALPAQVQLGLIACGGFMMTCTVGPVSAIVVDVVHPGVRATGCAVLALFQNLLGLAAGPFIAGALSDAWGLEIALAAIPGFGALAAMAFLIAARSYGADKQRANEREPATAPAVA
jgi:MFS family permease